MNPHGSGQPKYIDENYREESDQQGETGAHAPVQHPVKKHDKAQAEKTGKNIGYVHGPVIESGLQLRLLSTMRTVFVHRERLVKREASRWEESARTAAGAAQFEHRSEERKRRRSCRHVTILRHTKLEKGNQKLILVDTEGRQGS